MDYKAYALQILQDQRNLAAQNAQKQENKAAQAAVIAKSALQNEARKAAHVEQMTTAKAAQPVTTPQQKTTGELRKEAQTAKTEYEAEKKRAEEKRVEEAKKSATGSSYAAKSQQEDSRKALEKAAGEVFANYGAKASQMKPTVESDERELKAKADYYQNQAQMAESQEIMEQDLEDLETWSEEDRRALDQYIMRQDQNLSNMLMGDIRLEAFEQNPLIEKYGEEKVRQLANSITRSRNAELTQQTQQSAAEMANKHPVIGNVASVGTMLIGSTTSPMSHAKEMMQGTGKYPTLDPNNIGNLPNVYGGTVRQETSAKIRGDGSNMWRNLAAIGYQGGMSILDNLARIAASGGSASVSAAIAASGSFGNGLQKYSAQGADPGQAALMAFADAGLEYVTEKLSDSEMLEFFKGGTKPEKIKKFLWQTFGVEPLSEEVNLFAGIAAEAAILGDKAAMNQQIGEMVANGMSYEEASREAWRQVWEEANQLYAVSMISGAGQSAAMNLAGNIARDMKAKVDARNGVQPQQTAVQPEAAAKPEALQEPQTQPVSKEQMIANALGEATGQKPAQIDKPVQNAVVAKNATVENAAPQMQNETAESASVVDSGAQSTVQGQNTDTAVSKTYSNSGLHNANENVRQGYREQMREDPDAAKYTVKHNADTMAAAQERTSTPEKVNQAYTNLMGKEYWAAEDVATSTLLLDKIMASGEADSREKLDALRQKRKEMGSAMGQVVQAFAIQDGTMEAAESPATAVDTFNSTINSMKQEDTTYNAKKAGVTFEQWKENLQKQVDNIGIAIACVEDGDKKGMLDIVRQIAKNRKTTAMFGYSNKLTGAAERVLNKLDFDTLKTIANTQVAAMADDYRRRTAKDAIMAVRKQNMLSSIKTTLRNLAGNSTVGLIDSASDSGAGQLMDFVMSKFTGKRTIGNEVKHTAEYMSAAKDAAQFASLCVELNIPIETDAAKSFAAAQGEKRGGKYIGKTFRANGNPAMRALYATQKYMAYALEVTDKIFEGGTNESVLASLESLNNNGLTEQEAADLAEFTANRRTFKNATWEDSEGKTGGATLARATGALKRGDGEFFGTAGEVATDVIIPYVDVAMNVAQTGIDYTAGAIKGATEMLSVIKDARAGKTIDPRRQRQAASDFARGVTGVGMIALATAMASAGVVKVSNDEDKDKRALEQSEGLSNVQWNWSAMVRGLNGESTEWQKDDVIMGMDFLEPFNTQLYLGYELAQEESFLDMLKAYPGATMKSVFNSLMDSPLMTGISEISDLVQDVDTAMDEGDMQGVANAAAGYAGDVATSFIPQYVRQAEQYTDGYYRDTSGDTPAEAAMNQVKAAIPGLSQTLPMKYSGTGEEQKRGGFMNTFVDPFGFTRYQPDDITRGLAELSQATGGDKSFYPEATAPKKIRVNGEDVLISGKEMTEIYQKTYGDNINAMYSGIMESDAFQTMSADQKAEALKKAKEYATARAKAAVSDYDAGLGDIEGKEVDTILQKVTESAITGAMDDYNDGDQNAYMALEEALSVYNSLPTAAKKAMQESGGRIGYYLEAREAGISSKNFLNLYGKYREIDNGDMSASAKANEWANVLEEAKDAKTITKAQQRKMQEIMQFRVSSVLEPDKYNAMVESGLENKKALDVTKLVQAIKGTGSYNPETGKRTVTDADKYTAIANVKYTDREIDLIMKAYMPDYDPTEKSPDKTELKYDTIRDLGYSPEKYAATYRAYQSESKKAGKIEAIMNAIGCSKSEATQLYKIYYGSYFK